MTEPINIRLFNKGTVTAPDAEDISLESSSDALNVEPDITDGKLRGIPTNGDAYTANSVQIPDVRLGEFIENNGVFDFIYHDKSDGTANNRHISAITNFYGAEGSRVLSDLITSNVSDNVVMIPDNREIHIGTGYESSNIPKWVGNVDKTLLEATDIYVPTGTPGLDDMTGDYSSNVDTSSFVYEIEITTAGATDKFKWKKNGGTASSEIAITGTGQLLSHDVYALFGATTGHTLGDKWYIFRHIIIRSYVGSVIVNAPYVSNAGITISNITIESLTAHTGSAMAFDAGSTYKWALSVTYDGRQESPLGTSSSWLAAGTIDYMAVKIKAEAIYRYANTFNLRIDSIKLYKQKDDEAFRLAKVIPLDDTGWTEDYTYTFQDTNVGGNMYEEETGIAETLEDTIVNYSLACKGNGFLFVGKCYHPSIEEASQCIFRSMSKRFDMFDWSTDIVRLPRVPTAMAFFLGKLYAFDTNNLYVINPDNLLIEEIYPGAGAVGQRSVTVTPFGMFFANETNAFMFDGREIVPIGNRIKLSSSSGRSWQTFAFGVLTDIIVLYDTIKQIVLFINDYNSKTFAWVYHISKDRWDAMDFGGITIDANSGAFLGKDGETYLSNATQTVRLFSGASRQNFEWISQELTLDDPSQDKMWYNVIVDSSGAGSVTTTYGIEGATPTTALTGTQIGTSQTYAKTLKIKLVSSGIVDVDSIAILARRMRGVRVY